MFLRVLVVEKTRYFGGTTAFSGGGAWIPNNKYQPTINISDSTEDAEKYIGAVMGALYEEGDKKKLEAFLRSGPEMVRWIEESSLIRFQPTSLPDYHVAKPGASAGRTIVPSDFNDMGRITGVFRSVPNFLFATRKFLHYGFDLLVYGKGTYMANGNALVGQLVESLREAGVDMWNNTPAVKGIMAPKGEGKGVIGIQVARNGGSVENIRVTKGIVLASGGLGRSEEAKKYMPHEWTAVPRGNTGDGNRIGVECGGTLPPPNPYNGIFAPISLLQPRDKNKPIRRYPHFNIDRARPGSIIVGPDGKRFANESEPYQEFVATMHDRRIKKVYYIGDQNHLRKYGMGMALPSPYPIGRLLRQGYLISASSIAELAAKINVPITSLEETVAQCNGFAQTGKDLQFHRGDNAYDQFYGDPTVKPNSNLGPCA
ncbi:hypothetical protein SEUCBS140593_006015 [Sporothrix eucalyptigena]|uniref:FAD-dependent oxidoreductase 2 FAD-binding domain-containing protein n=1 Tax=Sporothrix eucalyptigena TaxID=1812306 RepID=A0ABP0C1D5_9PEZI